MFDVEYRELILLSVLCLYYRACCILQLQFVIKLYRRGTLIINFSCRTASVKNEPSEL